MAKKLNFPFNFTPPICESDKKLRHKSIRIFQEHKKKKNTILKFFTENASKLGRHLKNNLSMTLFKSELVIIPRVPTN